MQRRGRRLPRAPAPSGLADVIEIILDKGIVIDAYVRVSLVGIEILTIDARIVIASVDTYLRFAEATNRLDLYEHGGKDLAELVSDIQEGGASKQDQRGGRGRARRRSSATRHETTTSDEELRESAPRRPPARARRRYEQSRRR